MCNLPINIILRQVAASLSFCGSLFIIVTYFSLKEWTRKQRSIKFLLLITAIFDLISSANYFYYPNTETESSCALQSLLIQLFQVGSWFYRSFLALETAVIFRCIVSSGLSNRDGSIRKSTESITLWRHCLYHFICNGFTISSGIYLLEAGRFGFSSTLAQFWCWWRFKHERLLLGFAPLWTSATINLLCNCYVIYTLRSLKIGKPIFKRLVLDSVVFVLFTAPSTLRSLFTELDIMTSDQAQKLAPVEALLAMLLGFNNFIIWIVFDENVRLFWFMSLKDFSRCNIKTKTLLPCSGNSSSIIGQPILQTVQENKQEHDTNREKFSGKGINPMLLRPASLSYNPEITAHSDVELTERMTSP